MTFATLTLTHEQRTAIVTLNRPEKRNAISRQMIADVEGALHEIESSSARVAIVTGAGKAFCAGMDLETLQAFQGQSPAEVLEDARRIAGFFRRLHTFPKPLIAAVNGAAVAGGCGIAALADFTLASPEAKFGYTEVKVGFMPAIVATFVLRQFGEKRTRDLLLSGRVFPAAEAQALGLVNEIVPGEKLLERARELASELAALSPTALRHTKRLLVQLSERELDRELGLAIQASAVVRGTADFREGLAAFLEKRKPRWQDECPSQGTSDE